MTVEIQDSDAIIIDNKLIKISELSDDLKTLLIAKLLSTPEEYTKPDVQQIYNLREFEAIAEKTLSPQTFAYYRTGAEDEITLVENERAYKRIYFNPRILNSVFQVKLKKEILGAKSSLPFYLTAFAGAELDNNVSAERPLASGAGKAGIPQMIPGMTKLPLQELVNEFNNELVDQWLQIYVRESIEATKKFINEAEATKRITALVFTVDTAQLGRRETFSRAKRDPSFHGATTAFSNLNWDDLLDVKQSTKLKVVLKGIQSVPDAIKAAELGFDGIIISNHGGRQLDTTKSSIEILSEVIPELERHGLRSKIEVLIDGGVRRGSDVVKAIALGANGVGLGRPFLYALQTYQEVGVLKVIELLKEEIELTLRLLGVKDINDVGKTHIDTIDLAGNRYTGKENKVSV